MFVCLHVYFADVTYFHLLMFVAFSRAHAQARHGGHADAGARQRAVRLLLLQAKPAAHVGRSGSLEAGAKVKRSASRVRSQFFLVICGDRLNLYIKRIFA